MLKKIIGGIGLVTIVGILVFGAVNRSLAKVGGESSNESQEGHGLYYPDVQIPGNQVEETSAEEDGYVRGSSEEVINLVSAGDDELSNNEAAGLLFIREEEKLAHDVYTNFYAQYGTQNFQNTSQSEYTHSEAVKALIDRYGLTDLALSEVGVFTNPDLQALYDTLISQGGLSLAEAIKVGATIEEIDILDLQERLAQTDNIVIEQVYQNLLMGSQNHMRAFVAKYQQQTGEVYLPQYLSSDASQAIINADVQVGSGNLGAGGGNGGYRNQQP
jgi:hypothetical protein